MPSAAQPLAPNEAIALATQLRVELEKWHLGESELLELLLASVLSGGHVLLEGAPGLGKTHLVRALSALLGLDFGRIQCTPDLMPGDITGGDVLDLDEHGKRCFRFSKGPVFCQVLLADEINRATPRTQSALLEAMQEGQITSGATGHLLPTPFLVIATQNPIELEGTYPLPEAQLDRFAVQLNLQQPDAQTLEAILRLKNGALPSEAVCNQEMLRKLQANVQQVVIADDLYAQLAGFLLSTHPNAASAPPSIRESIRFGASPRAGQSALAVAQGLALLRGRHHVAPNDLTDALKPALFYRLLLKFEARATGAQVETLVSEALAASPIQ